MTPLLALVALAGGAGAVCRFVADTEVTTRAARRGACVPLGTLTVNVLGSLLLGILLGAAGASGAAPAWALVLGTGFLGGFTTFSTAMAEVVGLARDSRPGAGLGLLLATFAAGVAAGAAGLAVGVLTIGVTAGS